MTNFHSVPNKPSIKTFFCTFAVMKLDAVKYHLIIWPLHLVALFPLKVLYLFSDLMSFVIHRMVRYRLKVVRRNLDLCFPDMSQKEKRAIEKKFYRHLCDIFVETIKLLHISDSELRKRVEIGNKEIIESLVAKNKPIILYLAHYGNWEWVPALTLSLSEPKTMGALYKPLRNRVMNRVALRLRSRFSSQCIPVKTAYRIIMEMKREVPSFMIGFIADQRALGVSLKHWTNFFGQRTAFYAGGETIGDHIGAAYIYLDVRLSARGHYKLTFTPIVPEVDNLSEKEIDRKDGVDFPYTRKYFEMLETTIRRAPAYWLWSHNRWKAFRHPSSTKQS